MSKLSQLLEDLCPDGVEYKTLGDVGTFTRGSGLQKKDFTDSGVGCIHYGQIYTYYGTSTSTTKSFVSTELAGSLKKAGHGDLIVTTTSENVDDVCKAVAWMGEGEIAIGGHSCVYKHDLDPMYVAYYLQSDAFQTQKRKHVSGTKVKDIKPSDLARITVPVPPIEVQRAAVDILRKMEYLEATLGTELQAELEARTQQYKHYRKTLLTFERGGDIAWSTLGEVCTSAFSGGTPLASNRHFYDGGTIPWLRTQEVAYRDIETTSMKITDAGLAGSSARWVRENSVIVAISGAGVTRGRAAVNKIPLTTNQHCCNLEVDEERAHYRYVFHWISHRYEDLRSRGHGNRNDLNVGLVKAYEIALPPLAEQRRIAETLDKLNALVNDLSSALPAEVAARRMQYEYYRDLILTFPEKKTAA